MIATEIVWSANLKYLSSGTLLEKVPDLSSGIKQALTIAFVHFYNQVDPPSSAGIPAQICAPSSLNHHGLSGLKIITYFSSNGYQCIRSLSQIYEISK